MYPELIKDIPFPIIGSLTIHSFGVMFMLSFLIPIHLIRKDFIRRNIQPELASNIGIAAIIGGIIGARLYFIFERWDLFLADPWTMLFSGAGLVWYGGAAGGALAAAYVVKRSDYSFVQLADTVVPLLLLGNGIGRIGCLLAADGDYGPPSDLPWAMAFPDGYVPTFVPVHPTPLYDTLLAFTFFGIIWANRKRNLPQGSLMSFALIAMGVERFITEFFRNTPKIAFDWMTLAQMISLAFIATGVIYLVRFAKKQPQESKYTDRSL
jgi:phosphatidylglycerol:prolipoprotein diacylglycerol transferase